MNINKINNEAEDKQEKQLTQLHIAIEKACFNLLEDFAIEFEFGQELEDFIKKHPIPGKKWFSKPKPTKIPAQIEIAKKTLELNVLNKESCIDATIYLWEALCSNGDPMSKRERQYAEKAIRTCLQNNTINLNIIFDAIDSATILIF